MRGNVEEITHGGYKFVMEIDTGGDGIEYTCWVYNEDGSMLKNLL